MHFAENRKIDQGNYLSGQNSEIKFKCYQEMFHGPAT